MPDEPATTKGNSIMETRENTYNFGFGLVPAHRHVNPNGSIGGWVADSATVANTVTVAESAMVYGSAHVSGRAVIDGHARIYRHAIIDGHAHVSGHARIEGHAHVGGAACVYGHAHVSEHAYVDSLAHVSGHARIEGHVRVSGASRVYGHAHVGGNALISGSATISGGYVTTGLFANSVRVTRTPLVVTGFGEYIVITDDYVTVGPKSYHKADWLQSDNKYSSIIRALLA